MPDVRFLKRILCHFCCKIQNIFYRCEAVSWFLDLFQFTIFFKDNKRVFTETPVLIGTEPLRLTYPMYHEGMDPIGAPPIR